MTRMRLLGEAYEQLLKDDPETDLTLYGLRTIVKSGIIPTIKLGRKTLLNYDYLLEYFQKGDNRNQNCKGQIRPLQ